MGLSRHEVVRLVVAVIVLVAIYSLVGILRHREFGSSVDPAIFNQGVWLLSRFEPPVFRDASLSPRDRKDSKSGSVSKRPTSWFMAPSPQ